MTNFTPHETPAQDVKALPLQHPGRPVGRDDLIKDIYTHLQSGQAVLLHGASGNGKTTLAATLAAAFIKQPGGVLWLASGSHPLPALLVQVGRALGISDITTSEQPAARIGTLATALTQRKPFIVLDNVTDALAPQQFIEKAADNIPLVLISETELEGPWAKISVGPLADADAVNLYKQKSGITDDSHEIDLYGLTKLLGYQPLGIVMAARGMVAAKQKPGDYFNTLKQVTGTVNDATTASIALSYRALNNALQGLILMLGATFRGEASLDFLSAVSGVADGGITQAMNILSQLYLVESFERQGRPYYRLHGKVYEFAQAALKGKNQLTGLQKKIHDTTLSYAQEHGKADAVAYPELAKEMDNFLATAIWASEQGNKETANQLVTTLTQAGSFVQEAGYVYELLALRNVGSGSTTAFPAYGPEPTIEEEPEEDEFYSYDDDDDELDGLEESIIDNEDSAAFDTPDLGDVTVEEGMDSAALRPDALQGIDTDQLRQALAQARQSGDSTRILQILKALSKVQIGQGKETEAIGTYNEILETYESTDDTEGTLDALNVLAALLTKTGNSQAAVMHVTRGIPMAQERGDNQTHIQLVITLGDAHQDLGNTTHAVDAFKKGLELARKFDDSQHEAILLYKLGYAYLDNNDIDEAIHSLEQARELFKTQKKRDYEGRVLGGLGSAHSELEQWGEAIGYYQSALHIAREVEDKEDELLQLGNLGQAQLEANRLPEALLSYRQTLHLAYQIGKREETVSALVDLVRLMLRSYRLLDICDLLLEDGLEMDADDRDVNQLMDEVSKKRQEAMLRGVPQAPIHGSARDYAANAYKLLEQ